nr:MAG TPA: hypothetical protein [Caudoviricetes sp.]
MADLAGEYGPESRRWSFVVTDRGRYGPAS